MEKGNSDLKKLQNLSNHHIHVYNTILCGKNIEVTNAK